MSNSNSEPRYHVVPAPGTYYGHHPVVVHASFGSMADFLKSRWARVEHTDLVVRECALTIPGEIMRDLESLPIVEWYWWCVVYDITPDRATIARVGVSQWTRVHPSHRLIWIVGDRAPAVGERIWL
jgi:hypothetical protein